MGENIFQIKEAILFLSKGELPKEVYKKVFDVITNYSITAWMKKILKCSLCGNSLEDSKKILIKNIPESAQGFLNEQDRISRNYSATLFNVIIANMYN